MVKKVDKTYFTERDSDPDKCFDFFHLGIIPQVNKSNFPQHFFPIVALFADDCNYNLTTLHTFFGNLYIKGNYKTENNELMLRYNLNNDLIVARVEFIHKRNGNMSSLLNILKKIKRRYSLNRIIIESVCSEEMKNFCIKNNFNEMKYQLTSYELL